VKAMITVKAELGLKIQTKENRKMHIECSGSFHQSAFMGSFTLGINHSRSNG